MAGISRPWQPGLDVLDLTKAAAAVAELADQVTRIGLSADEIRAARVSPSAPAGTLLISVRSPDCARLVLLDVAKLVEGLIARAMAAPAFAETRPMED